MTRILFLCSDNGSRSQMAEGFARARASDTADVSSAGIEASAVHPLAVEVMAERGIDIAQAVAKALDPLRAHEFDVVISLCPQASRECPILPGNPTVVDWRLADPSGEEGGAGALRAAFRRSRDQIEQLVHDFFDRGYLQALVHAKRQAALILNNVSEGIIAHDLERRIFYFNRAAEQITEYPREAVMGRDCQDVFPTGFCGGHCLFSDPEGRTESPGPVERPIEIRTRSGETRRLQTSVRPMHDEQQRPAGVLVTFHDYTREWNMARRLGEVEQFSGIIGRDERMLEVFDLIRDVADSTVSVLIHGESGTGKELVAAAIHREGARGSKLFVPINCGALPESLLESELFGHVRGAFTGAVRDKKGRFELADEGTIFLDEIGDVTPAMQVKLLRVLQEGTFERVGSEETLQVDVRVIAATNKDLQKEIREGRFREDLYYRLSVMPILLPPLRERRTDIPLLANHVLQRAVREAGREPVTLSFEALDTMISYDWPGNVRELQNWLQFALVKCKDAVIRPEHLPAPAAAAGPARPAKRRRRRKLEAEAVRQALEQAKGNKVEAARLLGVSRATLYRFLDEGKAV